jgi:lipopolysaccharide transport system ATP-binding protein
LRDEFERGEIAPPPIATAHASDARVSEGNDGFFDPSLVPGALRYASQGARIGGARILTPDGRPVNVLRAGHRYVYAYRVRFDRSASLVRFGMMIRTVSGLELGGAASATHGRGLDLVEDGAEATATFAFRCLLAPGTYFLNAGVLGRLDGDEVFLDRVVDASMFRVLPDDARLATALVDFDVEPRIEIEVGVA